MNNALLPALGMDSQPWLGSEDLAIYWLGVTQVWFHTGQMMVVFIAGLQGIPSDYYEAAAVEGAGPWQRFRHVTWPLVAPATAIVVAYTTIQSFRAFDLVYAMTRGGPNHATEIMATWIYKTAFEPPNRFGVAAAQSVIFMLFIGAVTFAQRRTLKLMKADL